MSLRESLEHAMSICAIDDAYVEYSAREKYLAFAYTYIQTIQKEQSKLLPLLVSKKIFLLPNDEVSRLKEVFVPYAQQLINEGVQTGEIILRPILHKTYTLLFWQNFLQILHFWANDKSKHREETDVVIEKSVHFVFDTLAPNAIDSGLDYLKFLVQNR
ncbi:MAG: hypothetical protein R2760_08020 [Chitinophagales bacterium]|nr:hypothetical protein [Bacteroidota bacterium]MCB9074875.1 hypothetical protein [Chitinophagales bacterium]